MKMLVTCARTEMCIRDSYEVYLDGASTGKMETNLGGKLSFSVELGNGSAVDVKIVKC